MTGSTQNALGIYISIPFCRSKCTYCNFASGVYPVSLHEPYVARVIADLAAARSWADQMGAELPQTVDTVYLGGGTPTLLAPELFARLFHAIRAEFNLAPEAEITVECAPGQIAASTLHAMLDGGVNRASLGVQSFIDREAAVSGRLHSRATVADDLRRLRDAGIENISVDLVAGLAGQTFDSWQQSLVALADSSVPHASVYMLEVDEDSRLGRELLAHGARYHADLVPNDDAIARMYSIAIENLASAGLAQYEISNFSRAGFESRHNMRYWNRRPYLGVGLDASSMVRASPQHTSAASLRPVLRTTSTSDLNSYLNSCQQEEIVWISPEQQHEEAWFLGLRKNAGVHLPSLTHEFGRELVDPALPVVSRLTADGWLSFDGTTVKLTPQGRLLSNNVFQEFLDLQCIAANANHSLG